MTVGFVAILGISVGKFVTRDIVTDCFTLILPDPEISA